MMNESAKTNAVHKIAESHYNVCLIMFISTTILLVFVCCFATAIGICYCNKIRAQKEKKKRKQHRRAEREKRKNSYWSKKYAESPHYEYWQQQLRDSQSSRHGLPSSFREMFRKESSKPSYTINTPAIFAPIDEKSRRGSYDFA